MPWAGRAGTTRRWVLEEIGRGPKGDEDTAEKYPGPSQEYLPRENPTFHIFLEWMKMIVASDLNSFPEVHLPLGEAPLPA